MGARKTAGPRDGVLSSVQPWCQPRPSVLDLSYRRKTGPAGTLCKGANHPGKPRFPRRLSLLAFAGHGTFGGPHQVRGSSLRACCTRRGLSTARQGLPKTRSHGRIFHGWRTPRIHGFPEMPQHPLPKPCRTLPAGSGGRQGVNEKELIGKGGRHGTMIAQGGDERPVPTLGPDSQPSRKRQSSRGSYTCSTTGQRLAFKKKSW